MEIRGRSQEDPKPEGRWPREVTPHPRSGAAAESTRLQQGAGTVDRSYPASEVRGGGWEELPHTPKPEARGGGREELPHVSTPEARGGGREEQPTPKARGGGWEDQPHVQGAVAAQAQKDLEELSHVEAQEGWQ